MTFSYYGIWNGKFAGRKVPKCSHVKEIIIKHCTEIRCLVIFD
jgi:hypothetical protein